LVVSKLSLFFTSVVPLGLLLPFACGFEQDAKASITHMVKIKTAAVLSTLFLKQARVVCFIISSPLRFFNFNKRIRISLMQSSILTFVRFKGEVLGIYTLKKMPD
jgi:hypothetical protein